MFDEQHFDGHEECRREIERLQTIVAKLPVTADGVPVVPGMKLSSTYYDKLLPDLRTVVEVRVGAWRFDYSKWYDENDCSRACYSTREAAEAAREK